MHTPQEPAKGGDESLVEPTPCTGANGTGTLEAGWKAFIFSIDGEAEDQDIDGAVSFFKQARIRLSASRGQRRMSGPRAFVCESW